MIFQDVHVSGHACQEEIKLIYSLVHPRYALPVHGEYRHLKAQGQNWLKVWEFQKTAFFIMSSGDVMEMNQNTAKITGKGFRPARCLWTVWEWEM